MASFFLIVTSSSSYLNMFSMLMILKFIIRDQEDNLHKISIFLLQCFGFASGLIYNWTKSVCYQFSKLVLPNWTNNFGLTWAPLGSISKYQVPILALHWSPLTLTIFSNKRSQIFFKYYTFQRPFFARCIIVVNAILLSTLYYFIAVWCGSLQVT